MGVPGAFEAVQADGGRRTRALPWETILLLLLRSRDQEEAVTSPILVTGGTGTLGRLVVQRLRDAGCDVRAHSSDGMGHRGNRPHQ
jgi:hypothetical protein